MNVLDYITLDGITKYIKETAAQAMIADTETATATSAHAIGDIFIVDGVLYKATAAIAIGDTITNEGAGANVVQTSVAENKVGDVRVNGVSVVSNGIATIPAVEIEVVRL